MIGTGGRSWWKSHLLRKLAFGEQACLSFPDERKALDSWVRMEMENWSVRRQPSLRRGKSERFGARAHGRARHRASGDGLM